MRFFLVALSLAALAPACLGAQNLTEVQARLYFASATTSSAGAVDGHEMVAAALPNPSKPGGSRVELWRRRAGGYERLASAPKGGCDDCSGPTHKPNPTRVWIERDALHVEYKGGGSGVGFWAWRSSWGWDEALGRLRPLATQRIGADEEGSARHTLVSFVDGTRTQRLRQGDQVVSSSCRAAIARTPSFDQLSLAALFDGALEPDCLAGTDSGNPLAARPAPGSGALDNMLRSSSARAR